MILMLCHTITCKTIKGPALHQPRDPKYSKCQLKTHDIPGISVEKQQNKDFKITIQSVHDANDC